MGSFTTTGQTLNRNTLNQRASRARRRDYIQDLERRVHEYEFHGVQATAEVQAAARKVAEENCLLRQEVESLREVCATLERKIVNFAVDGVYGTESGTGDMTGVDSRRRTGRTRGKRTRLGLRGKTTTQSTTTERSSPAHQHHQEVVDFTHSSEPTTTTSDFPSTPSPASDLLTAASHVVEMRDTTHDPSPSGGKACRGL